LKSAGHFGSRGEQLRPPMTFQDFNTSSPTLRVEGAFCLRKVHMAIGTVKWFNPTKGYGFIQPEDGSQDVFVHISAVERAGVRELREGQKLRFEIVQDRKSGKFSAGNLELI